jgi:ribosomal protein S18 acetylase RimI-like enzyme
MIVSSHGLDAITTDKQYSFLSKFLQQSFRSAEAEDLLLSMTNMEQYFYFHKNKPVAMLSFKKRGNLQCTGTYYHNTIYNVATAPYYRKRGYMKKLFRFLIQEKRKQRLRHLHLEVLKDNHKAVDLYKSFGFEILYECLPTSTHKGIYVMRLFLQK